MKSGGSALGALITHYGRKAAGQKKSPRGLHLAGFCTLAISLPLTAAG